MEQKVKGIVIRKTKYRDNTAVVDIFTDELGIIPATAFGMHSLKNGKAGGLQLFTYGEFCLTKKAVGYTVKDIYPMEFFCDLTDYERFCAGSRLASCAYELFGETDVASVNAFRLLYSALSYTSYSDLNCDDIFIFFLLRAFDILGIKPNITNCAVCGKELFNENTIMFSNADGGAVCAACLNYDRKLHCISKLSLEAMRRMLLLDFSDIKKIKLPQDVRTQLLNILSAYKSYYI